MPPAPSSTRTKVQLKLVVQRLRMLQEKKATLAKRDRRDVASLVEKGKLETARIKTEGIVAEDVSGRARRRTDARRNRSCHVSIDN